MFGCYCTSVGGYRKDGAAPVDYVYGENAH